MIFLGGKVCNFRTVGPKNKNKSYLSTSRELTVHTSISSKHRISPAQDIIFGRKSVYHLNGWSKKRRKVFGTHRELLVQKLEIESRKLSRPGDRQIDTNARKCITRNVSHFRNFFLDLLYLYLNLYLKSSFKLILNLIPDPINTSLRNLGRTRKTDENLGKLEESQKNLGKIRKIWKQLEDNLGIT